jgi:cell division protein FtsB
MKRLITTCVLCLSGLAVHAADDSRQGDVQDPQLREELLRRTKTDQDARIAITNWLGKQGANDALDKDRQTAKQKTEFEKLAAAAKKADSENTA